MAGWQVATGVCIAAATLIKPTFLLTLLLLPVHGLYLGRNSEERHRRQVFQGGTTVISTLGALLLAFAALRWEGTPWGKFADACIYTVADAYSARELPLGALLSRVVFWVTRPWWWVSAFAAASPYWFIVARDRRDHRSACAYLLILLLLIVSFVSALVQGKGYMYQAAGMYVAMMLLALLTASALARRFFAGGAVARCAMGTLLLCFAFGVGGRVQKFYWPPLQYLSGQISGDDYYSRFEAGAITYTEAFAIIERIRVEAKHVGDEDKRLLVWSLANVINNETGYPQGTRFHHPPALLIAQPPFYRAAEWRREFIGDLERSRPFACVVSSNFLNNDRDEAVQFLRRFLATEYQPASAWETGRWTTTLYFRRPAGL
jgi:hypothetical protein